MANLNTKIQLVIHNFPSPFYGYISIIVGLIGDLLSYLLFPEFDLTYMISALGIGPGGIFFNLGLILSGLFALFFYLYLAKVVKINHRDIKLLKIAKISSINSCVFYCLIGIFPAIQENILIGYLHGLSAVICWLSAIVYLSSYGLLFLKSSNFLKFHGYLAFATALSIIVLLLTWTPITEWVMTFAIIIWIAVIASYTLIKKMH